MTLSVVSTDILFSVSNLVITTNFPSKKQALAGGFFNTVTQLGNGLGLAITAIIAAATTDAETDQATSAKSAILKGYWAAFWTCFAAAATSVIISIVGLRKSGKVGAKKDMYSVRKARRQKPHWGIRTVRKLRRKFTQRVTTEGNVCLAGKSSSAFLSRSSIKQQRVVA